MPARFHKIIHQQAQVSSFETFYSNPESLTTVLLPEYIEYQPSSLWYSPSCCWKMLLLSDLVTGELPQNSSCTKLSVAYQFSHRAIWESAPPRLDNREFKIPTTWTATRTSQFIPLFPSKKLTSKV